MIVRRYLFTFRGTGPFANQRKQVEGQGQTVDGAERMARARLRDETKRDSSFWATESRDYLGAAE